MDRHARFAPLGLRRNLLLDCLGGHTPHAPGYLDPAPDMDIKVAFRGYVEELTSFASDQITMLLASACRLLTGDLSAATIILDHLPAEPPRLRFGQRYCPLMPVRTLAGALPLPSTLPPPELWVAKSPGQAAVRAWLSTHSDRLVWNDSEVAYFLG